MKKDIFNELNKQQREAVELVEGPSIILAGAGSGKTRVLTYKVQHLIENCHVDPSEIMMVTFTNKAAGEMRSRVGFPLGFIGTFHSFGVRLLRRYGEKVGLLPGFVIYDDTDSQDLLKKVMSDLEIRKNYTPSFFSYKISGAKDQLIDPEKYQQLFSGHSSELVGRIYQEYQRRLEKNNAVDFDDLIFKTVKLLMKNEEILVRYQDQFRFILVDEFQDTNFAQYQLTKYLGKKYQNVTVVGDFSQGIYSWRGAEITNLSKFEEDFPHSKKFYLEKNYRSTQKILDFAFEIISRNHTHPVLKLHTENKKGEEIEIKELDNEQYEGLFVASEVERIVSADGKDFSQAAVLYRINAQSRVIEEAFLHMGIPYVLIGGTRFYERKEIKDILSYIRLFINPIDEVSLSRILKIGKKRYQLFTDLQKKLYENRGDIKTTDLIDKIIQKTGYLNLFDTDDPDDFSRLENIKELRSVAISFPNINDFLEQVALVESEYSQNEKTKKDKKGVQLMTLHQAKGLEFPYVFIVGVEEGILPHSRSIDDLYQLEEERRLFYVGITRARERLYITHTKKRFFFGRRNYSQPSRFIEDRLDDDGVNF